MRRDDLEMPEYLPADQKQFYERLHRNDHERREREETERRLRAYHREQNRIFALFLIVVCLVIFGLLYAVLGGSSR